MRRLLDGQDTSGFWGSCACRIPRNTIGWRGEVSKLAKIDTVGDAITDTCPLTTATPG